MFKIAKIIEAACYHNGYITLREHSLHTVVDMYLFTCHLNPGW